MFADTAFWLALIRERDQYGDRALLWKYWIDEHSVRILTTELIL